MKTVKAIGAALSACALILTSSQAAGAGSKVLPPGSSAFGHDLAYWLRAANASPNTMQGHVLVAPESQFVGATGAGTIADPVIISQAAKLTLKPGTGLVYSPIQYHAVPPEVILPDSYWGFGNYTFCEVVLDGQTVISEEDCQDYYVPPQIFNPPLSDGTYEAQGFYFALKPLSVGVHTLITRGVALLPAGNLITGPAELGLEFLVTFTITVAP